MATNLRLRPDAEAALRERAAQTGRSQQEIIRDAIDRYLEVGTSGQPRSDAEVLLADQQVKPPRSSFRVLAAEELIRLPDTVSSSGLLDREDRV